MNILLLDINTALAKTLSHINTVETITVEKIKKSGSPKNEPDLVIFPEDKIEDADAIRFLFKKDIKFVCLASPEKQKELLEKSWITDIWELNISEELFKFKMIKAINILSKWKIYKRNQMYLDAIINLSPDIIWFKNLNGEHMLVNDVFRKYTQKTDEQIVGKTHEFIWENSSDNVGRVCMDSDIIITTTGITKAFNEQLILKDNSVKDIIACKSPLRDEFGTIVGTVGIAKDVTMEKIKSNQLIYNATHDSLTSLLNRQSFQEELDKNKTSKGAVLFFDLDNFKTMNDKFGHKFGDSVIKMFAGMLSTVFPTEIVGRYGGDEFVVASLDENIDEEKLKEKFLILEAYITQAKQTDARLEHFGTSVGVSFSNSKRDFNKAMSFADIAMYRAKQLHKAKNIKEDFGQKGNLFYVVN